MYTYLRLPLHLHLHLQPPALPVSNTLWGLHHRGAKTHLGLI